MRGSVTDRSAEQMQKGHRSSGRAQASVPTDVNILVTLGMENLELEKDRASFLFILLLLGVYPKQALARRGQDCTLWERDIFPSCTGQCRTRQPGGWAATRHQTQVRAAAQNPSRPFTPPVTQWLCQLVSSKAAGHCSNCRDELLGSGREIYWLQTSPFPLLSTCFSPGWPEIVLVG